MEKDLIGAMTPQQRKELLSQLKKQQEEDRKRYEDDIEEYKKLTSEAVEDCFPTLSTVSETLASVKKRVRGTFTAAMEIKAKIYGDKEGQQSHTFMSADGFKRIKIGYNVTDNYDDTAEVGIAKVREYLASLAKDEKGAILVDAVLKLLAKDSKGTLKASRVLQLQQMADRSGDESFIEGVRIIRDAYKPIESKSYIRAEYKNSIGAWVSVPLSMTDAE